MTQKNKWLLVGEYDYEGKAWLDTFPTPEDAKEFAKDRNCDSFRLVDLDLLMMSDFDKFEPYRFWIRDGKEFKLVVEYSKKGIPKKTWIPIEND